MTNSVEQMVAALQAKSELLAIVMIVIAFLTPLISAMSAYFSKATLNCSKENLDRSKDIHSAVNGNNEAMRVKLEAYTQEILRLSTELSALREIQRIEATQMKIGDANSVTTTDKRISELIREEIAKKS